jgi:imidazolonepropionase
VEINNISGYFDGYSFQEGPFDVIINHGKIESIQKANSSTYDIDGSGHILSVPFTDGHTHLIFAGNRAFELPLKVKGESYSNILKAGGGILTTVKNTRTASDDELLELVYDRLDIMLAHGTLRVEAKSGYGLTYNEELRMLRLLNEANSNHPVELIITNCGAHAIPFDISRSDYIEDMIEILPIIKKQNLASSTDVFCDDGAYTVEETIRIFEASLEQDLPVRVHAEELKYTGIGKIASERFQALSVDHLLLATEDDYQTFAKNNTPVMFMPVAIVGLFLNQIPQGWQNKDLTIALGTDFNPNNLTYSMQTAIRFGVYFNRMLPEIAFQAATSGSYKATTGLKFEKLQEGSPADFILLKGNSINEVITPFDQNLVSDVFKNGQSLMFEY